jgi:hypothetical protein
MSVSVPLAFTQCCPGDDFTGMPSEVVHVYWSRRHSKIEHFIEAFVEGLGLVVSSGPRHALPSGHGRPALSLRHHRPDGAGLVCGRCA